jgi:hypothetical protein
MNSWGQNYFEGPGTAMGIAIGIAIRIAKGKTTLRAREQP